MPGISGGFSNGRFTSGISRGRGDIGDLSGGMMGVSYDMNIIRNNNVTIGGGSNSDVCITRGAACLASRVS